MDVLTYEDLLTWLSEGIPCWNAAIKFRYSDVVNYPLVGSLLQFADGHFSESKYCSVKLNLFQDGIQRHVYHAYTSDDQADFKHFT